MDGHKMAKNPDIAKLQEELVDAFEWNEDDRARGLVSQLATHPRQARAALDEMLASEDASMRRAAVFALGELGGPTSAKRLEQQMAIEEARESYDGSSVLEVLTLTLGRVKGARARASLIGRLKRLVASKPTRSDVNDIAYALWRKRDPELIPVVRSAIEQLLLEDSSKLRALLHLLEAPPEALVTWALDPSISPKLKADVLSILDEELPDELFPAMLAFISAASALGDTPVKQRGEASDYCERLFILLMINTKRLLPTLSTGVRADLRALARRCVASVDRACAIRAAHMLERVGHREDAALVEAHRPVDETLAEIYDEIAQNIRKLPNH
jgi:hypothetical protein